MKALIKELTEAIGPSGFEGAVRDIIRPAVESHVDQVTVDAMGNLIAYRAAGGANNGGRKVMLAAHMDEIGLMVTHVTEKGFLRLTNIGGIYPQTLHGARVQFLDGRVGVVYREVQANRTTVPPLDKHFIDIGASSRDDSPIGVGAVAAFQRPFLDLGERYVAKSIDDRIGCAILIETLQRLEDSPHELYFVFSVQEEIGARGSQAAANHILPDIGLAVDVTSTGDTPNDGRMAVNLGDGPAIKVKDRGMLAHAGLVRHMRATAEDAGQAYQLEILEGGSTDARSMQVAGAGSAAGCVSIPCRYVHSQSETVAAADVEGAVALLTRLLAGPLDL